jgi:hypothetical protein
MYGSVKLPIKVLKRIFISRCVCGCFFNNYGKYLPVHAYLLSAFVVGVYEYSMVADN